MTFRDFIRVVREQWLLITVGTCIGAVLGLLVFLVRPPEYAAQTSLYVSSQAGSDPQQAYLGAELSQQRVKSYVELVTGERVLDETIRRLQLPTNTEGLASQVSASSALDSVVITISVRAETPQLAAQIANTVGASTIQVVNELERPGSPNLPQSVLIRVVQPADMPDGPATPSLLVNLALGLIAGLVLATLAGIARSRFDTSIRSGAMAAEVGGGPLLGRVPLDPRVEKSPLIVKEHPQSPCAEAFRQVRTNLQFLDVDNPQQILVVCSAIPEEGKSTTVANLGLTLSQVGYRVLIVEADLRRPQLTKLLGLESSVGLTTVLAGRATLANTIQPWAGGTLEVLASGQTPPNPSRAALQQSDAVDARRMPSALRLCADRRPTAAPGHGCGRPGATHRWFGVGLPVEADAPSSGGLRSSCAGGSVAESIGRHSHHVPGVGPSGRDLPALLRR